MRKSLGFIAAALALAGMSTTGFASQQKDGINNMASIKKPVSAKGRFIGSGNANPYKHNRTPKKNQRQLRKLWRQTPYIRSKYK